MGALYAYSNEKLPGAYSVRVRPVDVGLWAYTSRHICTYYLELEEQVTTFNGGALVAGTGFVFFKPRWRSRIVPFSR